MTFNVHTFSVDRRLCDCTLVDVDNSPALVLSRPDVSSFTAVGQKIWEVVGDEHQEIQPPSRLQQILSSRNHIVFVVPDDPHSRELSVALRIAHDLNVHHRLDAEILLESEVLPLSGLDSWSEGNIVFIGKPSSVLVQRILGDKKTPFETRVSSLGLNDQALDSGCSALFLHPHLSPAADEHSTMLFMISSDVPGLERLARLFPIRTGIAAPSWVVLNNDDSERIGAAGVTGAGVWGRNWKWNDALSWYF